MTMTDDIDARFAGIELHGIPGSQDRPSTRGHQPATVRSGQDSTVETPQLTEAHDTEPLANHSRLKKLMKKALKEERRLPSYDFKAWHKLARILRKEKRTKKPASNRDKLLRKALKEEANRKWYWCSCPHWKDLAHFLRKERKQERKRAKADAIAADTRAKAIQASPAWRAMADLLRPFLDDTIVRACAMDLDSSIRRLPRSSIYGDVWCSCEAARTHSNIPRDKVQARLEAKT